MLLRGKALMARLGLLAALTVALLPALHDHAAPAPAGTAEHPCTLCAVFSGVEPSGPNAPARLDLAHSAPPAPVAASALRQEPLPGIDGRAPPLADGQPDFH